MADAVEDVHLAVPEIADLEAAAIVVVNEGIGATIRDGERDQRLLGHLALVEAGAGEKGFEHMAPGAAIRAAHRLQEERFEGGVDADRVPRKSLGIAIGVYL